MEYKASVTSPLISGEVTINMKNTGFSVSSMLDTAEIFFYDINAVRTADYKVFVLTDSGKFIFEKMGQWCEPFYQTLRDAYQAEMRKALFISSTPVVTLRGEFTFIEKSKGLDEEDDKPVYAGTADIEVYDNAICFLTGDTNSRRVPLCFLNDIKKESYGWFEFILDNGDRYSCSKLGYETAPFEKAISDGLKSLREKSSELIKEIEPNLNTMQLNQISKKMIEGAAASISTLTEIAPELVAGIEKHIAAGSRIADTFDSLKSNSDSSKMYVGIKKEYAVVSGQSSAGLNEMTAADAETAADAVTEAETLMFWLIAPSPKGNICAVEFVGGDDSAAATFIYKFNGDFENFAVNLNYALEAIEFKRNVIRIPASELRKPDNAHYALAVKVNSSLNFVRECFQDRIIHSSPESWEEKLKGFFNK